MRTYLPILVILLAVGGLLWFFRYYQEQKAAGGAAEKPVIGDIGMQFDGVRLIGWGEGGEKRWEFRAKTITVSKDKITSTLKGISEGTFYKDGKPIFRVKAKEAVVQGSSRNEDVKVRGGLTIAGENGVRLSTGSLEWYGYRKKFVFPDPITASFRDLTLKIERAEGDLAVKEIKAVVPRSVVYRKGERLFTLNTKDTTIFYDEQTGNVRIQGNVRVDGKDGLVLKTDAVEWHDREEKVICPNAVEVVMRNSRLVAEHFESDPKFQQMTVSRFRGRIALGDFPQTEGIL